MFRPQTWGTSVLDQKELYGPWAWNPLPPPGSRVEAGFVGMRLIAPAAALRRTVAEFAQLGGAASTLAPAAPPLQDRLQVVLAGTAAQFERFMGKADPPVVAAVRATLHATIASPPAVALGRHQFHFASRVYVAGILNNTPDSFYDRGRYYGPQTALARADEMIREGADVIEVGGETAQEGDPVPAREHIERVAPP